MSPGPKSGEPLCGRSATVAGSRPKAGTRPGAQDWRARLDEHLSARGLKKSDARYQIAEAASRVPGHFTIQEIARHVQEKNPGIGTATVYRCFPVLVEAGVLRQTLEQESGEALYEWEGGAGEDHHDHLVCLDCGAIFEFHDPKIERLQRDAAERLSFEEERHRHVIYARCKLLVAKPKASTGRRR